MDDSLITYRSMLIAEDPNLREALEIISDEELSALRECSDCFPGFTKSNQQRVKNSDDVDEWFE